MIGTIAFDVNQRRPGCVIIQRLYGADLADFQRHFPVETWLLSPTPTMALFAVENEQQLLALAHMAGRAVQKAPADCKDVDNGPDPDPNRHV